jgi:ActR/RegA family two-component response regulator
MPKFRILLVDDEETIRLTLPPILERHGFAVEVAATVPQALAKVANEHFDVLIADLNVGRPGDGFTVVSAMRCTQPNCINFILTGFPAFETALEAIRRQVDDYLLKPIEVETLVESITRKIKAREPQKPLVPKRVATILRENIEKIAARALAKMKDHPEIQGIEISDSERTDHVASIVRAAVTALESSSGQLNEDLLRGVAQHGGTRWNQGYPLPLMVEDVRLIDEAIYEVIQENLLCVDVSHLIPDLRVLNKSVDLQLKKSIEAVASKAGA